MFFDKLMDFLFRSWRGRLVLLGSISAGAFLFGGCMVPDCMSCACEKMGCDEDDVGCWSSCNDECNTCGAGCGPEDCAVKGCLFGDGCETECGNLFLDCGGCNRTICTECDIGCDQTDTDCTFNFLNCASTCTDEDAVNAATLEIVYYDVSNSDTVYRTEMQVDKRTPPETLPLTYDKDYYTLHGFFGSSSDSLYEVADEEGNVTGTLLSGDKKEYTIYGMLEEKHLGELYTFSFSAIPDGAAVPSTNVLMVKAGDAFETLPRLSSAGGYTFVGWTVNGQDVSELFAVGKEFHPVQWKAFGVSAEDRTIDIVAVYVENNGGAASTSVQTDALKGEYFLPAEEKAYPRKGGSK